MKFLYAFILENDESNSADKIVKSTDKVWIN